MHGKTLEVNAGICVTGNRFPITDGIAAHDLDRKVRTEAVTFVLRKIYRARLHDAEVMHIQLHPRSHGESLVVLTKHGTDKAVFTCDIRHTRMQRTRAIQRPAFAFQTGVQRGRVEHLVAQLL